MLRVQQIRKERQIIGDRLKKRGLSEMQISMLDEVIAKDDLRKNNQAELDALLSEVNSLSREIGEMYKTGRPDDAQNLKNQVADLKSRTKSLEARQKETILSITDLLLSIPNVPHASVPAGSSETDNEVFKDWPGPMPVLPTDAMAHWDLAKNLDIIDFELGVKLTGAGFPVYRGKGAKLQRALISFFLDQATSHGYQEIIPPLLVNQESARATGQLPDKEGQMYHVTEDDLYLIPTAEVPITNIMRDVILKESELPVKLTGYTPCFRREAGSYGSDVKGLNRVHQFDKVEIVQMTLPEDSYHALKQMVDYVSTLLDKLELPYRILRLCGGDLGFTSALTFDFEVYSAAQKKWLEVSSVSNFETFQSNRLKLRFRNELGEKHLVHTLNGSALALARVVAALLENNQTAEGVKIPKALIPYTSFELLN